MLRTEYDMYVVFYERLSHVIFAFYYALSGLGC
jgi:hypothetical protein